MESQIWSKKLLVVPIMVTPLLYKQGQLAWPLSTATHKIWDRAGLLLMVLPAADHITLAWDTVKASSISAVFPCSANKVHGVFSNRVCLSSSGTLLTRVDIFFMVYGASGASLAKYRSDPLLVLGFLSNYVITL